MASLGTTTSSPKRDTIARYLNPLGLGRTLWRNQDLIRQFARRDVEGRYRGSFLGLLWSFVNPLILLGVYTLVFGIIFVRHGAADQSNC